MPNEYKVAIGAAVVAMLMILILMWNYRTCDLNKETFQSSRQIILHYTDWCPACQRMKPVWLAVKSALARSNIVFSENDEAKNPTEGVSKYPTIVKIDELGRKYTYSGGADYATLLAWVKKPVNVN